MRKFAVVIKMVNAISKISKNIDEVQTNCKKTKNMEYNCVREMGMCAGKNDKQKSRDT